MPALKQAARAALWFAFLTFPLMVIKVNPYERTVVWRWQNLLYVALAAFVGSLLAQAAAAFKTRKKPQTAAAPAKDWLRLFDKTAVQLPALALLLLALGLFPHLVSSYQVSIMITALLYVMLGLGLNIVVGMAGLLDLGYVAFYAVGAYSYALLNLHFGIGFWLALPIGGLLAALFGILLGFPVLRLRGDYLAIVTLGFGEIIRLVLENWTEFSQGPSGISGIPRPGLFGLELSLQQSVVYLYYLMLGMVIFTIFAVSRLRHSRIGRAWAALREDEIACRAMGIDKTGIKLAAFASGAFWAGMAGVLFAAKTTFVNPASFTFMESAIILCIVVLGGMGSILGVIIAALTLILLPEYLRALADYRMLAFGAVLVLLMIFRPGGLLAPSREKFKGQ
ncbi:MAG: ABC transporter permease subunit [Candidatus Electronema sp. V4]|uniref:ABC transporter permease subunit n=1 Tax=Candidatus Electronema sp. V4 TaxID=3454756 RepID=UPI0040556238